MTTTSGRRVERNAQAWLRRRITDERSRTWRHGMPTEAFVAFNHALGTALKRTAETLGVMLSEGQAQAAANFTAAQRRAQVDADGTSR